MTDPKRRQHGVLESHEMSTLVPSSAPGDEASQLLSVQEASFSQSRSAKSIPSVEELPGPRDHKSFSTQMWQPIWLQWYPLTSFAILYALLFVGLIILWAVAKRENGLSTHLSTNHYTWTYGPTAVLVVVVSLWRQVDYYCKCLSPWHELSEGNASADRSLFLDYVFPWQGAALWKAIRNQHFHVSATILGFIILKLMTLFSTGLLVLLNTNMTDLHYPLVATSKISAANFNASTPTPGSSGIFYAYYGTLLKGLPFPVGTKMSVAFESFESRDPSPRNAALTAEVDAFVPLIDCEIGQVTNLQYFSPLATGSTYSYTLNTPSCHNISVEGSLPLDPKYRLVPSRQLYGESGSITCATRDFENYADTFMPPGTSWLLTISEWHYEQTTIIVNQTSSTNSSVFQDPATGSWLYTTSYEGNVTRLSALVCNPSYTLAKVNVTYDSSKEATNDAISVSQPKWDKNETIRGFSNANLSTIIWNSYTAAMNMFEGLTYDNSSLENADPFFQLMSAVNGAGGFEAMLENATSMQRAAVHVFQGTATQLAAQNFTLPTRKDISGQITFPENRLHVQVSSLWVMLVFSVLLVCLTVLVLFTRPVKVVPGPPDCIAANAVVLRNSPDLQSLLTEPTIRHATDLRAKLRGHGFSTKISASDSNPHGFQIHVNQVLKYDALSLNVSSGIWWRPWSIRSPAIGAILVLPLILIGVLELLQQLSDRNDGFVAMPSDPWPSATVYTRYLPALIMLLVATLFSSLDEIVSMFAPFSALKAGSAPASRSLFDCTRGRMAIVSIPRSAQSHHWGTALATFAGLVGSLLTIIASGLYVADNVIISRDVTLQRMDWFNLTWNNSVGNDQGAASTLNLLEHFNLTYPLFTHNHLVFPTISLSSADEGPKSNARTPFSTRLPALRSTLNCTQIPSRNISVFRDSGVGEGPGTSMQVRSQANLPPNCQLGGKNGTLSYIPFQQEYSDFYGNSTSYAGSLIDIHVGPFIESAIDAPDLGESSNYGESEAALLKDNPAGCPSLVIIYGALVLQGATVADPPTIRSNVSSYVCYQQIQEVMTDATFFLPGYIIDPANPPVPDESSVRYLTNGTDGITSFPYRPEQSFSDELGASLISASTLPNLDNFFQAVVFGSEGVPAADLMKVDVLLNATNGLYQKYMAQAISANMRQRRTGTNPSDELAPNNSNSSTTFYATLFDDTPLRLKQDNASKIALQIMLGVMFLCACAAYILTDMRKTLIDNPCSIVGTMSLLAGSELCDPSANVIPPGTQWVSEKGFIGTRDDGIFTGWLFSLGWWPVRGQDNVRESDSGESPNQSSVVPTAEGRLRTKHTTKASRLQRFGLDIGRAEKEHQS